MEHLEHLIKKLNRSEKKMARKFLAAYSSNGKSDTLNLQLFDLLSKNRRGKALSSKDCSIKLFGKDKSIRIRVLKSRVKHKVLDAMTTDIIIDNLQHDEVTNLSIHLKKKLAQFQILYYGGKGDLNILLDLLDEVIAKSEKYELYALLLEALNMKKIVFGYRKGIDEYSKYEALATQAQIDYNAVTAIVNDYYKLLLMYRSSDPDKIKLNNFLIKSIKQGIELQAVSSSMTLSYYLNIIKYANYTENDNLIEARLVMMAQSELLKNSSAIKRKRRQGATLDYLCQTNIKLGKYAEAKENAQEARLYFIPNEINYTVALTLEFKANLFSKQFNHAEENIKNILKQYKESLDAHRLSTHKFLYGCLLFAKKDFKKCNRLLSEDYEFKKDRTGWEFSLRLLHIMCLLEQNKHDGALVKYNNLMRLLDMHNETEEGLTERNKLILTVLDKWLSSGVNKEIANLKSSSLIKKFDLPENKWDPLKSELIPFHTWIQEKV